MALFDKKPKKDELFAEEESVSLPIEEEEIEEVNAPVEDEPEPEEEEEILAVNGWNPISTAPFNGIPVKLSASPDGDGILGFWKRTRAFSNVSKRYESIGKWVDSISGADLNFHPKYWKERF